MKIASSILGALLFALSQALAAAPLLFHDHGHGLSYSPNGKALFAPSEHGLAVYEGGQWWTEPGPSGGFTAFSVSERALYSSGHSRVGAGLLHSLNGGRTWHALARGGHAAFRHLSAGYRSKALYVLNVDPNAAMPHAGLHVSFDEGRSWRYVPAGGLGGEVHAIAAHPDEPYTVAIGTDRGLYLSRDGGQSFTRLDRRGAVTAVVFDTEGKSLRYASALEAVLFERSIESGAVRRLHVPKLERDYVTCLAQNPIDKASIAIATRRREVYLTGDGGLTWRRITDEAELERASAAQGGTRR